MSSRKMNPIVVMLSWRAKKLRAEDVDLNILGPELLSPP